MKYTKEGLLTLKTPYEEFQHKTVLEENKDLLEALSIEEKYQLANLLVSGCAYKDIEQYKSLGLKVYKGRKNMSALN